MGKRKLINSQSLLTMNKSDLSREEIKNLKEKLLAQINKELKIQTNKNLSKKESLYITHIPSKAINSRLTINN